MADKTPRKRKQREDDVALPPTVTPVTPDKRARLPLPNFAPKVLATTPSTSAALLEADDLPMPVTPLTPELHTPRGRRSALKNAEKNKGLSHFSRKVLNKVEEKRTTSYKEVAEELVREQEECERNFDPSVSTPGETHGPKNIKRRVYDALNVLMALDIIGKDKKEIKWKGLPETFVQNAAPLEEELHEREDALEAKKKRIHELIHQTLLISELKEKNRVSAKYSASAIGGSSRAPSTALSLSGPSSLSSDSSASGEEVDADRLAIPFLLVSTNKNTVIDCQMAEDKTEFFFDLSAPFEIHDDVEVLKRMGLGTCMESGRVTRANMAQVCALFPRKLHPYVEKVASDPSPFPQ